MNKIDLYFKNYEDEIYFFFRAKGKNFEKWKEKCDLEINNIGNNNTFYELINFLKLKRSSKFENEETNFIIYTNVKKSIFLYEINEPNFNIITKYKNENCYIVFNSRKMYMLVFKGEN